LHELDRIQSCATNRFRGHAMRLLIVVAILFSAAAAAAAAEVNCSRTQLQTAVNGYIAAQTAGDPELMPILEQTRFIEQMEPIARADSIVNEALAIDFERSILDEYTCQTYTEVIVLDEAHPRSMGVRLRLIGTLVAEVEAIVTDEGDWLFNAAVAAENAAAEDWSVIPPTERSSRAVLEAAANAYFDQFLTGLGTIYVPWGYPCRRLEGGAYTGRGTPQDSCSVGVPDGSLPVNLAERRFVTDPARGATVGLVRYGAQRRPDAHLFRIEHGKLRWVHTLTVCEPQPMCGGRPGN
jgi:hypothetical protein